MAKPRSNTAIEGRPGSVWSRLGWFLILWVAGGAVTAVVAYGLKALLPS